MVQNSYKTLFPNFYFLPLQRWMTTYLPHPSTPFLLSNVINISLFLLFWRKCCSQCLCCCKQSNSVSSSCNIRNTGQVCRARAASCSTDRTWPLLQRGGTASLATGNDSDPSFCINCQGRSFHLIYPCRAQAPAFLFLPASYSDLVKLGGFDANPASLHTALPNPYFQRISCAWL